MTSRALIREQIAECIGPVNFKKLVDALSEIQDVGRLTFWQERLLEKVAAKTGIAIEGVSELLSVFAGMESVEVVELDRPEEASIDWNELENRLYGLSVRMLSDFAAIHPDEVFYGFAFECVVHNGGVLLCLNTEEDLRAAVSQRNSNEFTDAVVDEIRWNTGNWKYQGFNEDNPFDGFWTLEWMAFEASVTRAWVAAGTAHADGVVEMLLRSVCKVVARMEADDVFVCLRRTSDFMTFVCSHNESLCAAWDRIASVRQALS